MQDPFVDTDILIRLLTKDDLKKQAQAAHLFEQVEEGKLTLQAPDTVIADAVYVLASPRLYHKSRSEIREFLTPLLNLSKFRVRNRKILLEALDCYANTNLDFGDTMIVSSMLKAHSKTLYSYDTDFDKIPTVTRIEP